MKNFNNYSYYFSRNNSFLGNYFYKKTEDYGRYLKEQKSNATTEKMDAKNAKTK